MDWELKSDRPIYTQLLEELKRRIVSGVYQPGEKLLSVRELAQDAKVNPNTMQRALTELERQSLVFAVRTTGRYITEDTALIEDTKKEFATFHVETYDKEMRALGYDKGEMIRFLSEYEKVKPETDVQEEPEKTAGKTAAEEQMDKGTESIPETGLINDNAGEEKR